MTTPIPLFLIGAAQTHRQACKDIVRPEFEIIETADSEASILERLPPLLASNKLAAVIMGGAFSNDIFHSILSQIDNSKAVPWFRPEATRPGGNVPSPSGPPTPQAIAERLRTAVCKYQKELEHGDGKGEVWYF